MSEDIKKIRELLEFLVKQKIIKQLKSLSEKEKKVYELTGNKGQSEVAKLTGISAGKISSLWQKWEKEGILIKKGKKYKKLV